MDLTGRRLVGATDGGRRKEDGERSDGGRSAFEHRAFLHHGCSSPSERACSNFWQKLVSRIPCGATSSVPNPIPILR